MRNNWSLNKDEFNSIFYSKEETIENVRENFDIRRLYSAEGYDILINGVSERCLVQTSSNPLRELNDFRKIHCPITADVKRGYYVKYEDSIWLIDTNVANIDGAYLSTRMTRCQYILRWLNKNGEVVERHAYASDQTKYSNGQTGNQTIMVGDNQYALLLPIDEETKLLKRGMRFAVDFDDSEEPDVYELTNRKIKLAEGTISITLSFDAFNKDKDKLVTLDDGSQVWICDYHSPTSDSKPPSQENEISVSIVGNENLKIGFERTYTSVFKDRNNNEIQKDFSWNIVSDFPVKQKMVDNNIKLSVNDEDYISSSFLLQVIADNEVAAEMKITVVEGF